MMVLLMELLVAAPAFPAPMIYDKVVAVVGSTPILLSEVRRKVEVGPLTIVSTFPSSQQDVLFDRALHDAINMVLMEEEALERGIEVSEKEIEEQMDHITAQQNATRDELVGFLESQGISMEEYREDLRLQLLFGKFQGRVLAPQIRITQRRLQDHYHMTYQSSPEDVRLHLWQIVAKTAQGSLRDGEEGVVQACYGEWSQGRLSWQRLQHRMQSADAAAGGCASLEPSDLGMLHLSDLAPGIRGAFGELATGSLSRPVLIGGRWRLFYIAQKASSLKPHFTSQKQQLEWQLRSAELQKTLQEWLVLKRKQHPLSVIP